MSLAADIASARRRRGASWGLVTRLTKKLKDLEGRAENPRYPCCRPTDEEEFRERRRSFQDASKLN